MPSVNLSATKNACVSSSSPTTNYNGATIGYFIVGQSSPPDAQIDASVSCRAWIGFDLSSVPVNAVITSASLTLHYFYDNDGGGGYSNISQSLNRLIGTTWNPATITWNTAPDSNATGSTITMFAPTSTTVYDADLITDVTVDITAALSNRAIDWRINYQNILQGLNYYSKSSSTSPPLLSVTYTLPSGAGALFFGSD